MKGLIKRLLYTIDPKKSKRIQRVNDVLGLVNYINRIPKELFFKDKYKLYDHVLAMFKGEPIVYLEFGVFEGKSLRHWLAADNNSNSKYFGFDSFEGLPEKWEKNSSSYEKGRFNLEGRPPDIVDPRLKFVVGVFQATLVDFIKDNHDLISSSNLVVHLDADLYSSQFFCLARLYESLPKGAFILFDDFYVARHDYRAWNDFVSSHLISFSEVGYTKECSQAAFKIIKKRTHYLEE